MPTTLLRPFHTLLPMALMLITGGLAHAQTEPGMHKGDADAPIVLVEYVSPTCSHCRDFIRDIGPTIDHYVKAGKVRVVFREFLRNEIDVAVSALARCAPDDQYFDVMNAAFAQQDELIAAAKSGKATDALVALGQEFGIADEAAFNACYGDTGIRLDLAEMSKLAEAEDFTGVPAIFVNGDLIEDAKAMTQARDFAAKLDAQLAKQAEPAN